MCVLVTWVVCIAVGVLKLDRIYKRGQLGRFEGIGDQLIPT
jgi:hypothetical protein